MGLGAGDYSKEEKKIDDDVIISKVIADDAKSLVNSDDANMCRICFSDDIEKENPLITPCKCSGSM